MERDYAFDAEWDKPGVDTNHKLDLQLDLTLSRLLEGRDLATELRLNEGSVRREIQKMAIEDLIPSIIRSSGKIGHLPEGTSRVKTNIDTNSKWKTSESNEARSSLTYRSKMQIVLDMNTDRAMNAMQALNLSKPNLAANITDTVIADLKSKYFGTEKTQTRSETRTANGKLIDYLLKEQSPN
jgi:hypothetical protein